MAKYPNVRVKITGTDSNAFFLIGTVTRAMRREGVPADKITEFTNEAMSGDYSHVLATIMDWVDAR